MASKCTISEGFISEKQEAFINERQVKIYSVPKKKDESITPLFIGGF
jgi:hypothetical protein